MPMIGKHKSVEFATTDLGGQEQTFKTFDEAAGLAVSVAASSGRKVHIDVLVYSAAGARWWGGDYAVEDYMEDPDASVFARIEIKANVVGRIA